MAIKAEYIWIDGTEPTARLRSKTRILADDASTDVADLPIWGFDGSSTNQAPGDNSDCVLKPVAVYADPIRGGDDVLVMCEVLLIDMTPHPTNHRAACAAVAEKYADMEPLFGIEQEYTFFKDGRPLGFPVGGFPAPQGFYYCGVGADEVFGRDVVEAHMEACLEAGIALSGINAEVMPGQWEFQVGPIGPLDVSDQLWTGTLAPIVVPVAFNSNGGDATNQGIEISVTAQLALPHRRGVRRQRHGRGQARQGRLERRRCPHQLLHQGHA